MYNPNSMRTKSFPFHATTRSMLTNAGGIASSSRTISNTSASDIRRASDLASRLKNVVRKLGSDVDDLSDFLIDLDPSMPALKEMAPT